MGAWVHGSQILKSPKSCTPKSPHLSPPPVGIQGKEEDTQGPAASGTRAPTAPAIYTYLSPLPAMHYVVTDENAAGMRQVK